MKTEVIERKDIVKNGTETAKANPVTAENNNPRFVAGNVVNKDSAKPAEPAKPEAGKSDAPKAEAPKAEAKPQEQPKTEAPKAGPQAEPAKPAETKKVLNLEGTLKVVDNLYKKMRYRDRLIEEIKTLDAFDVELRSDDEEADVEDRNFYQGCKLTIEDGKGRTFVTRNATIIWTNAQMMTNLFTNKLAEIESDIVLPQ